MSDDLAFRAYDASIDENFVYDSFLNSFGKSHFSGVIPRPLYRDTYREVLNRLIARGVRIVMAYCPELEPPYDLYGWTMVEDGFEKPVVHYIYVKEPYRRNGVAKMLLDNANVDQSFFYYTFRTQKWRHFRGGVFRPQLVWHKKPAAHRKRHEQKSRSRTGDVSPEGQVPAERAQQHRRDDDAPGAEVVQPESRRRSGLRGRVLPYKRREIEKIRAMGGSDTALASAPVHDPVPRSEEEAGATDAE